MTRCLTVLMSLLLVFAPCVVVGAAALHAGMHDFGSHQHHSSAQAVQEKANTTKPNQAPDQSECERLCETSYLKSKAETYGPVLVVLSGTPIDCDLTADLGTGRPFLGATNRAPPNRQFLASLATTVLARTQRLRI